MVYLDADNNLEEMGVDDFLEMASVGSTAEVNIVVQFDRSTKSNPASGGDTRYGDWTTTKRFLVQTGMEPTSANEIADLGEVNMAAPSALANFVLWAMAAYPADYYFLDLWDHGIGWEGVILDQGTFMKTSELAEALRMVYEAAGKVDIIGNDACRMTVEIDYELRNYADFFVGSEKDEPLAGWPYDALLAALVANPSMGPRELGQTLVDVYVASYVENSLYSVTLSVIESAALPGLAQAASRFVAEVNRSLPYFQKELLAARDETESYEGGVEFDLYDFAREVQSAIPSRRVKDAATSLMSEVLRAVSYEAHWDNPSPINGIPAKDAHGLSVWFPVQVTNPAYHDLDWSKDTGWNGFLLTYRDGTATDIPVASTFSPTDADGDGALGGVDVLIGGIPGGTFEVDAYGGSVLLASGQGPTDSWVHLQLPEGAVVDLAIYAFDPSGVLVNYTEVGNVLEVPFTLSGYARNDLGEALPGILVKVTNNRTGESYSESSDAGGWYSVSIPSGAYATGDNLTVEATFEGRVRTIIIVIPQGITSLAVDLYFERPNPGGPDDVPAVWVVALLGIEAAILVAALLYLTRRKGLS
jgi:hypothetical protein